MVKVKVNKNNNNYQSIDILGHAGFSIHGKDIVCSAISSIVITSINGILSINDEALKYEDNKEGIKIYNIKNDNITIKLLDNMINLLKELEDNYPKNINVL